MLRINMQFLFTIKKLIKNLSLHFVLFVDNFKAVLYELHKSFIENALLKMAEYSITGLECFELLF